MTNSDSRRRAAKNLRDRRNNYDAPPASPDPCMSATASDGTPYTLSTYAHGDSAPCHAEPPACGCPETSPCGAPYGPGLLACTAPFGHDGDHTTPTGDDDGVWAWA